jgi:hypothetical protein
VPHFFWLLLLAVVAKVGPNVAIGFTYITSEEGTKLTWQSLDFCT